VYLSVSRQFGLCRLLVSFISRLARATRIARSMLPQTQHRFAIREWLLALGVRSILISFCLLNPANLHYFPSSACNPGFWISSDGTGCLPDGTAFAAFSKLSLSNSSLLRSIPDAHSLARTGRQLVVLSPTGTQPHTAFLERPTPSSLSSAAPTTITNQSVSPTGALNQLIVEAPPSVDISSSKYISISHFL